MPILRRVVIASSLCASLLLAAGCGSDIKTAALGGGVVDDRGGGVTPTPSEVVIKVLSNRSDLISGGDALVEIVFPASADPKTATVWLNAKDVTTAFARKPNERFMGLVDQLVLGSNTLTVKLKGFADTSATIVNYPNGGPIFAGPQTQPWNCQSSAKDAQCNQPAEYSYLYKSTGRNQSGLQPYDPANPPSDVATTTTADGVTMPFIVRLERGYQDRDEYRILTLFDPAKSWSAWAPQPQWNHKVLVTHGGGCGSSYGPSSAPLDDYAGTIPANPLIEQSYITALGMGFAVMSTALDNAGHNCSVVVQAESLMMAKERLVEQYGEIRYTIGTGCSGGSITQATVANAYPGIYQGLITMCAYPDTFSAGAQFANYHLLRQYFEGEALNTFINTEGEAMSDPANYDPGKLPKWLERGVVWTPTQMSDVEGHILPVNAIVADIGLFNGATQPIGNCAGANSYRPDTKPDGVRCGVIDYLVNIFGVRDESVWTEMERAAGKGFAGIPLGNVGVQYGLNALREGKITPAQFADLNAYIGGLDIDIKPQAARTAPDTPALANVYRSGMVNMTNNMNTVAILNFLGPDPGVAHDSVHAFWVRWRLDREHGNHDNHVMWAGPVPMIGDLTYVESGLRAMDRWLAAVEQDVSDIALSKKIVQNKPADIHDQCSNGFGVKTLDDVCLEISRLAYAYGTPSTVAGDSNYGDKLACQLKPLKRDSADYTYALNAENKEFFPGLLPAQPGVLASPVPITFTDAEWALLQSAFPNGVCDFSKPGKDQQPTLTWLQYGTATEVIYGGAPLPAAPAHSRSGWASPAFVY